MPAMKLIGLDIGTTSCKAVLFDQDGSQLAKAGREYFVDIPHAGWAEQDAAQVWRLAKDCLRELTQSEDGRQAIGISLSVQGEAVMPVDRYGNALRPMILGMDTRTADQNEWLTTRLGAAKLFECTGMPVHTINTLPKLLWIKQHEPENWKQAERFVLYEDYINWMMTGRAAISACLASRTQLFDLRAGKWNEEILNAIGLDPSRLSEPLASGTPVGPMRTELARELGFARPPLVVCGGHDQACGALGVGLTRPGLAEVSTGTAEVVEVALASPALNPDLMHGNISVYRHTAPGLFVAMTLNHSGGMLLRWFRDTFCQSEIGAAQRVGQDPYDLILAGAVEGPTSLMVLPHFAGSGTPTFDTRSKGAFLGLTFSTGKAEMAKAILEGLTFELRVNLDLLQGAGVVIENLRAIGGGAKSDLWLQMKADITGIPVLRPRITEAAAWGAAVLAGHGAGLFPDIATAVDERLVMEKEFVPDPRSAEQYAQRYGLYCQVYPALAGLLHQMDGN